jgi:hypothetical protein
MKHIACQLFNEVDWLAKLNFLDAARRLNYALTADGGSDGR